MLDQSDGFKKSQHDMAVEQAITTHCNEFEIDSLNAIKLFPVLARRQWLKRFLAHVELFKLTLDVPGDIVELGVFRGLGLFTWANLLETYCIGDRTKMVWGLDSFSNDAGFESKYHEELVSAIVLFDADRFIAHKPRIRLRVGNISNIVSVFDAGIRFSLLHFDCDLYQPTLDALDVLWPRLSRGGVAIFDEYGIPEWPGETEAVDEFLDSHPGLRPQTFSWTNTPGAYLVKP